MEKLRQYLKKGSLKSGKINIKYKPDLWVGIFLSYRERFRIICVKGIQMTSQSYSFSVTSQKDYFLQCEQTKLHSHDEHTQKK